jgi:hypothetical protein
MNQKIICSLLYSQFKFFYLEIVNFKISFSKSWIQFVEKSMTKKSTFLKIVQNINK